MGKVQMYKSLTEDAATLPASRDACRNLGSEIYFKAVANLAAHKKSGNATVEISDTDYYDHWGVTVSLIDGKSPRQGGPGALAIEYGHYVRTKDGPPVWVEGLHIMSRAAGLKE